MLRGTTAQALKIETKSSKYTQTLSLIPNTNIQYVSVSVSVSKPSHSQNALCIVHVQKLN